MSYKSATQRGGPPSQLFDKGKAFADKLRGNGLPAGTPLQIERDGVMYEQCADCSERTGCTVMHPVGVPCSECVEELP